MSPVQQEEDDMYFHAVTALDMDSKAYAMAATRSAAKPERKLLVAFDGSSAARCALEFAVGQASECAIAIHVVNVQPLRSHQHVAEKMLEAATVQLDMHGIRHTTEVAFGDIAESIVRSAAMERCDLIVIGARNRLAIANFFSASVSSQVVRLAHVPVTVIKQKVVATTHSPRRLQIPWGSPT
jgi:nucleotide-binding universal stress UspA family protein